MRNCRHGARVVLGVGGDTPFTWRRQASHQRTCSMCVLNLPGSSYTKMYGRLRVCPGSGSLAAGVWTMGAIHGLLLSSSPARPAPTREQADWQSSKQASTAPTCLAHLPPPPCGMRSHGQTTHCDNGKTRRCSDHGLHTRRQEAPASSCWLHGAAPPLVDSRHPAPLHWLGQNISKVMLQ